MRRDERKKNSARAKSAWVALLASLGLMETILAHDPGLSSVVVKLDGSRVEAVATFARKDIESVIEGSAAPGHKSGPERSALSELAGKVLAVENAGRLLEPETAKARLDDQGNVEFRLGFAADQSSPLELRSCLLPRLPLGHRQFLSVTDESGATVLERLLRRGAEAAAIARRAGWQPEARKDRTSAAGFLALGVKHILTGYDHLLFLLALLVVTQHFSSSLRIITCFTLAHSLTLAMAALNVLVLPSRLVEPLIAASIVYVSIENLVRRGEPAGRWALTFGFGLVHGLGFASVLREMGVGGRAGGVLLPLCSFNLGVELGQLMVAALVLSLLWKARSRRLFFERLSAGCSVGVGVLGTYWLFERLVIPG
jgi:hydrogenase/urease accessory protein HupE